MKRWLLNKVRLFIQSAIPSAPSVQVSQVLPKEHNTQLEQIIIKNQFLMMKATLPPHVLPSINEVGFRVHSQFEEDGILLYIFAIIGTTNKRVVEICAGEGSECMAANLILNHGWEALLFDGDEGAVERGRKFFENHQSTFLSPPIFKHAWLTAENVNQLIEESQFSGTIDLLSLDIDGNDYHVLKALEIIKPRVILCETQNVIPYNLALTIPYDPNFNRENGPNIDFMGASLFAMQKMLVTKGYRLIGTHKYGFNAFFMLNGVGDEFFPEVSVQSVLQDTYSKSRNSAVWTDIKDLGWMEV